MRIAERNDEAEWCRATHAVQDQVIGQLMAYRDTLDDAHRERLEELIAKRSKQHLPGSLLGPFWGAL